MKKKKRINKRYNFFDRNREFVFLSLLIISVIVIYSRTSSFEFVNIDDRPLIFENQTVVNPEIPYSQCFQLMKGGVHYKPLVFLSWKLEYNLLGNSPWHFHTINWILHLLNTLLLFFILKRILKKVYDSEKEILRSAFFIALIYTINPLRIESVAWATERKDVLFGFFFLLSWLFYLKYLDKKKLLFLLIGAFSYLLSTLSKSMGITLIAVIIITDLWYSRRINYKLILEKIPFLIVFVIMINLYGLLELKKESNTTSQTIISERENAEDESITSVEFLKELPMTVQWGVTTSARFVIWIAHSIVPIKLSVIYSHNGLFRYLGKTIFLFPFIVIGLYLLAWKYRKRNKVFFAGMLFFVITIAPALVLKSSGQAIFLSDRYTYIPSIGLFFIIVIWLSQLKNRRNGNILLGITIIFFFVKSLNSVGYWKNSGDLFEQALKVYPNSGFAHMNLGKYYFEEKDTIQALKVYTAGINREPGYYRLYANRGKIYFDQGLADLAINDFDKCLSLKPDFVMALANRGSAYGMKMEYDKALVSFNKALEISPNYGNALTNRGLLYMFMQDYEKAITDYAKYLENNPNDADIINSLGLSYHNLRRYNEALNEYDKAIQIDPSKGAFYYNRSLVYNSLGDKTEALQDALMAQKLGANINQNYINSLQN